MSLDLDRLSDTQVKPPSRKTQRRFTVAASVSLAIAVSGSLAPARNQDPAEPPAQDQPEAKGKASTKKAAPKKAVPKAAEPAPDAAPAPAPVEVAPDTPKKADPLPPPGFARVPKTPSELWEVVEFFVRSGQAPRALPYIEQFLALNPDDATYLRLRDEFGEGAFLQLGDASVTRPYMQPIVGRLNQAIVRNAQDPARIARHVSALTQSVEERNYAIRELRSAGSTAVPVILQAIKAASGEDRAKLVDALGRLDRNATPALIAALDSKDEAELKAVIEALARIGDERAIPQLNWVARRSQGPGKSAAQDAIARLTGAPLDAQENSSSRILSDEARSHHLATAPLANPAIVWLWDDASGLPVAKTLSKLDAHNVLGTKLAKEALALDPSNLDAQRTLVSLSLDRAPAGTVPAQALAAGADLLGSVVRQAIADRRNDLAVKAIQALAKVSDRNVLGSAARSHALIEALGAPDRRIQIAAAEAVVNLEPKAAFPGSSRVVPILARFAANPSQHGAIVIDGNPARASQVAGYLHSIGYDPQMAYKGEDGFRLAAGAANVELVLIDPSFLAGAWTLHDTLANLKADARTAGLPIFLVGPLNLADKFASKTQGFPGLHFLVSPTESVLFKGQIDKALGRQGVVPLTEAERSAFAIKASQLLTRIARTKGSPFAADLTIVEPNLVLALNHTSTAEAAALALGDIPGHDAQRNLAAIVVDATRPIPSRLKAAEALAHSLRRFGPLITAQQEIQLAQSLDSETDPALKTALATVVGALKPKPAAVGRMLRADGLSTTTK